LYTPAGPEQQSFNPLLAESLSSKIKAPPPAARADPASRSPWLLDPGVGRTLTGHA
jgi:hypothetical protein